MKTVKEAAQAHFDTITLPGINTGGDVFVNVKKEAYKDVFLEAFEAGAKYARRWISVEEELPSKMNELYFVKGIYRHHKYGDLDWYGAVRLRSIYKGFPVWKGITDGMEPHREKTITHWRYIELK